MFTNKIHFRKFNCKLNGNTGKPVEENYVNIYVKISDKCNASCDFCEFRNISENFKFNFKKFSEIVNTIKNNNIIINKVSFTGGEPTLNIVDLKNCLNILKKIDSQIFTVVNSNGFNLEYLLNEKNLDNISLSRHHINDEDNYKIFKTASIPSSEYIKKFHKNNKIHLTCNLIKGNIDNVRDIRDYLEFANSIGIFDVGFVGLMKINEYCRRHYVNFSEIIEESDELICNKNWEDRDICRCKNYLYLPKTGKNVVKFYSRERCKNTEFSESNLVFDGEYIRDNFNGKILY